MVAEVPLYRDLPAPPADPSAVHAWFAHTPAVAKRDLRKGFPKSLVRQDQDLHSAMQDEQVTLLATSGTTADRLQVIWEWSWWDPQERDAMRLNKLCLEGERATMAGEVGADRGLVDEVAREYSRVADALIEFVRATLTDAA